MPIVEIPNKKMTIEFPDTMSDQEIESTINTDIYGVKPKDVGIPGLTWAGVFRDAALSAGPNIMKGIGGLAQMTGELSQQKREVRGKGWRFPGREPSETERGIGKSIAQFGVGLSGLGQEALSEVEPQFEEKTAKYYFYNAMSSVAQNMPLMFAGAATGQIWLPLTAMGAQATGQQYSEFRKKGLDPDRAAMAAAGYGLAEVIGEKISLGFLMKPGMAFVKKLLLAPLVEISEEELTEAIQAGIDKKTIDPNMTWKDLLNRGIETAIVAGMASPIQTGIVQTGLKLAEVGISPEEVAVSHGKGERKEETSKVLEKYQKKAAEKKLEPEPGEIKVEEIEPVEVIRESESKAKEERYESIQTKLNIEKKSLEGFQDLLAKTEGEKGKAMVQVEIDKAEKTIAGLEKRLAREQKYRVRKEERPTEPSPIPKVVKPESEMAPPTQKPQIAPVEAQAAIETPPITEMERVEGRPKREELTGINFKKLMESFAKRTIQEEEGQAILDNLSKKKISPTAVSNEFWDKTYFNLPAEVQAKFQKYAQSITGLKPGDVMEYDPVTKEQVKAKDWIDIGKRSDLGDKAENLEGTERGYVALMDEANRRFGEVPPTQPLPKPEVLPEPPPAKPEAPKAEVLATKVKEPWEMTREEFVTSQVEAKNLKTGSAERLETAHQGMAHRKAVQQALSSGKPVPPEVLAYYPDLQKPVEKPPEPAKTSKETMGEKEEKVIPYSERDQAEKKIINEYDKKMNSDEWVKAYEEEPEMHFTKEEGHSPLADELLQDLDREGIKKGAQILDIGSGIGRDSIYLAKKGHVLNGIDVSETAIQKATERAKGLKATFQLGDAENLYQFEDGSQDAVISIAALHGTPIKFTFKEIYRVLKSGGQAKLFLYTKTKTGSKWISYWTPGEIKQYATENGFKIEKFREHHDSEPISIPGLEGKIEQETHSTILTMRKPKGVAKPPKPAKIEPMTSKKGAGEIPTGKTPQPVGGEYVYHGTSEGAARTIQREGLIPSSVAKDLKQISLSSNEQYAQTYADRKSPSNAILRVKKDDSITLDERIKPTKQGYDLKSEFSIPTERIEIKTPDGWIPLKEWDFIEKKRVPSKEAPKTPEGGKVTYEEVLEEGRKRTYVNYRNDAVPEDGVFYHVVPKTYKGEDILSGSELKSYGKKFVNKWKEEHPDYETYGDFERVSLFNNIYEAEYFLDDIYNGKGKIIAVRPSDLSQNKEGYWTAKKISKSQIIGERRYSDLFPSPPPPAKEAGGVVVDWSKGEPRPFAFDPNSTQNEGRFRLLPPDSIQKDSYFRRKSSTPGISYLMGKDKTGKEVTQAIRFDKRQITEEQAGEWWEKNKDRFRLAGEEAAPAQTFRQFVESKGEKWPLKATNPRYPEIKAEWDALQGRKPAPSPTRKGEQLLPGMKVGLQFPTKGKEVTPTLEGTPLGEAARKAEQERIQPKLGLGEGKKAAPEPLAADIEGVVTELRELVEVGEPGKRIGAEVGETISWGSSYPTFMKNQGWTKQEVLRSIKKGISGKPLFAKEQRIFDAVVDEARAINEDRKVEMTKETERKAVIAEDPDFLKENTIKSLTNNLDDEIIGMKEEWREQGLSESEIGELVKKTQEALKTETRPRDIEGIKKELGAEGREEPPLVKEPAYADYEKTVRAIPITREEALKLQDVSVARPEGGGTLAVYKIGGPDVTGTEGWYLKDLPLYEGKEYPGKGKTTGPTKAQRDLHNTIRSDLDRVSGETPKKEGAVPSPPPLPSDISQQRVSPSKEVSQLSLFDTLKSESGQIDLTGMAESVKEAVSELQKTRLMNCLNWRMGKNEPDIRVLMAPKKHLPQIGAGLRNMESVLSQTKQGRDTYEAGRDFKGNTVRDFTHWQVRAKEILESLDTDEKLAVLEILDTEEDIEHGTKIEDAASDMRQLLNDFRDWMIESGQKVGRIEGYFPHVFQGKFWVVPAKAETMEQGLTETYLGEKGQVFSRKVDSFDEAVQEAKKLRDQTGRKVTIMQDTFIPPDDATLLSNRSYWRLVKAIQEEIGEAYGIEEDLDAADINKLLRGEGVARPKPKKRFFGNLMPRLKNNPNFIRDIDKVMDLFLYGGVRKVHQDIFLKRVQKNIEAMPIQDDRLKKFVEQNFVPGVLAHPTNFEESIADVIHRLKIYPGASGQDVRKWMHNINLVQYVYDMGLSASSAAANASQFFINAYPIVGERSAGIGYAKGAKTFWDPKLLAEVEQMNITSGVSSITGQALFHGEKFKNLAKAITLQKGVGEFADATLFMFQGVELQNRFAAYWAGKDFASRQLESGKKAMDLALKVTPKTSGFVDLAQELDARMVDTKTRRNPAWWKKTKAMRDEFARKFGFELNDKANFRVGRENLPSILRNAPVRIFSPYKSFLLNQLKYTLDTLGPKGLTTDPKKALRFVGMSLALGGVAANPVLYGIFQLVNMVYKWLFDKDLEKEVNRRGIARGLSGMAGVDISGSVAIQLPTRPEDLLGRFGKLALELGKVGYGKATGGGTIFAERTAKRLTMPAQVQRAMDALKIVETGLYISPIKKTPIALTEAPWSAAIKRFLGIMPGDVAKTYDAEKMIEAKKAKFKSLSQDMTERFTTEVAVLTSSSSSASDKEKARQEINFLFSRFLREINRAAERLVKAEKDKNWDAMTEARTDFDFWNLWLSENQKFKEALIKKTVPRQLERQRHLPKYLRPEALMEAQP